MVKKTTNAYTGFSKLTKKQRLQKLVDTKKLSRNEAALLNSRENLSFDYGENFIENFIGYYQLPVGVATNFVIDKKLYVIPMAVEETSIIAAASKTAKWIQEVGAITTANLGDLSIGQIQLAKVKDVTHFKAIIAQHKKALIARVNAAVAGSMVKRGGGVMDINTRIILRPGNANMVVLHILVNTCDAMGANIINQVCEYLRPEIEKLTHEKVTLCILSNLNTHKLTRATVTINKIDRAVAKALVEASLFAEMDPYRAATSNKGVLNAMDAVAIATGNDWRAVEAGIHAYAAQSGHYRSVTTWRLQQKKLVGTLIAPVNIGTVGGVTALHPTAKLCLNMLGVKKAGELARVMAAVGLVQNLAAIKALTGEGIVQGHMRLHATNMCLAAGANEQEIPLLTQQLTKMLTDKKHISLADAKTLLAAIRAA